MNINVNSINSFVVIKLWLVKDCYFSVADLTANWRSKLEKWDLQITVGQNICDPTWCSAKVIRKLIKDKKTASEIKTSYSHKNLEV